MKKTKKKGKSASSTTSNDKKTDADSAQRISVLENEIDQLQKGLAAATENINQLKKTAGKRVGEDRQKPEDLVGFYFEIFPPGRWDSKDFTQHYKELVQQGKFQEREVQWDRIREIENLKPNTRRKGKLKWNGYVVYEFAYTDNVVLECPVEGNAVYILKGNQWKRLIQLTKGEIRDKHKESYKKVVHKNGWVPRVKKALRDLK